MSVRKIKRVWLDSYLLVSGFVRKIKTIFLKPSTSEELLKFSSQRISGKSLYRISLLFVGFCCSLLPAV